MYFVVFLKALKKNVVLPTSWIENITNHFEKFLNYSLNSSQTFRCFHTTDEDAFIESRPNEEYQVDFSLELIEQENGENYKGCFLGQIKKFKWTYDDAVQYMERQRNKPPAIYNENRLNEQPIPEILNNHEEPEENIDANAIGQVDINSNTEEAEENEENISSSENNHGTDNNILQDGDVVEANFSIFRWKS